MKSSSLIDSFNHAVAGIIYALKHERNMKIHFLATILVLGLSLFLDLTKMEFLMIIFSIALVISAELMNTAIERTVDLITDRYHPLAKAAKDIAAGGVLVAAINAGIVGYLIFFEKLNVYTETVIIKVQSSPIYLTFIAILLTVIFTIGIKTIYQARGGTPFQGGIVSGHSAISFCTATIITFLSRNTLVTILSYSLALLVGESRIEGKIHSLSEVVLGAILGILIGIVIFQFLA